MAYIVSAIAEPIADTAPSAQALEEQVEKELQAERAAAEAEADRVKAAIEEKRREREQVEAALRTAVRSRRCWRMPLTQFDPLLRRLTEYAVNALNTETRALEVVRPCEAARSVSDVIQEEEAERRAAEEEARAAEERLRELQRKMAEQVPCWCCNYHI